MSAQLGILSRSARGALVGLCAAWLVAFSSHSAFASLVVDLRFTGGATTLDISSMSASQTVVIEVWATVTGTDGIQTNDGLTFNYFGLLSANTDTPHLAGSLTNSSAVLSPFTDLASFNNGTFADRNADTIGDWRGTATSGASALSGWAKASFSLSTAQFGGGTVGQSAGPNSWAFHIADAVFQIGSISTAGVSGTQNVLRFNPVIPAPLSLATRANWQEDGVSKNGSSGPTLGTSVTFTLTGAVGNPDIDPTPSSLPFAALLLNAALPPSQNVTLTNNGNAPGSYSTSTTGVAVVTSGATGGPLAASPGPGNTALMGVGLAAGTTTTYGLNKPGTVVVATTGDPDSAATDTVSVTVTVGEAATSGTNFGLPLSAAVASSGGYNGLASRTTTGGGNVGNEARMLGGSNASGAGENVQMRWRQRTAAESTAPTSPPLPASGSGDPARLISDVVELTGLDYVGAGDAAGRTDPYVLQMTYDPAQLQGGAGTEGIKAAAGSIFLAWLDPDGAGPSVALWRNAVAGNFNNAGGALFNFQGTYAAAGSPTSIGSWGVDIATDTVWAVLDHASEFAVVPEPSSIALMGLGAVGMILAVRRRRSS